MTNDTQNTALQYSLEHSKNKNKKNDELNYCCCFKRI